MRPKPSERPLEPSPLVRRFAPKIAAATEGRPILDVACGSGRNAVALSQLGCIVICADRELTSLRASRRVWRTGSLWSMSRRLELRDVDFVKDPWPFVDSRFGGIINVHFLLPALFPYFVSCLSPGSYLLLETVPGCGGNYLELPRAGELSSALERDFEPEFYEERKVGPVGYDAVTVRVLARKRR